ncbi:MAG: Gfo/Idh/MocA family oxidoreductase [Clostridia bacterium]|nr:Gfo/Idh/MocA family oxidoreductase [Clostridia bacterium]
MIKVAIVGFGGIAQAAHMPGYVELEKEGKAKLVAVCDVDPTRFDAKLEINLASATDTLPDTVKRYTDWQEMLDNEEIDMVDLCVPTFLHADLTVALLERGVNVLCEKPMSLSSTDCRRMCEAAKNSGKQLMIGQCIRFCDHYTYLKEAVADGRFGKVKGGIFRRLSTPPVWGWENWFMDYDRSHGCVLDLHIHDVDFAQYAFGLPMTVSCTTADITSGRDIAHSTLHYNDFALTVIGDWSQEGLPFTAEYRIAFEKATVDYSNDKVTVYPRGGEAFSPELDNTSFYVKEIRYFVDSLETGAENTKNKPESAAASVGLIEALCTSADNDGQPVTI